MLVNRKLASLLKGKKLLIFDFDGTLADTSALHAAAFQKVLWPHGVTVHYPSIAGMRTSDAIMFVAQCCKLTFSANELNDLVLAKQNLVREMMRTELRLLPGADRVLQWARQRYRLSMATSGSRRTIEFALEQLGYSGWFDPLICAEDVARTKPSPDLFNQILKSTGSPVRQALIFEDSLAGIMAAKNARIAYVHIKKNSWIEMLS